MIKEKSQGIKKMVRTALAGVAAWCLLASGTGVRSVSGHTSNSCAQPLFQPAKFYSAGRSIAPNARPTDLAVGDYNLDGRPDFVATLTGVNLVSVFLNTGGGTTSNNAWAPPRRRQLTSYGNKLIGVSRLSRKRSDLDQC